jgi:virulence-associated protein VagC
MKKHRYDCKAARRWYMSIRAGKEFVRIPMTQSYPNKDVEAFVKGFLRLLLPTAARLPDTFTLDNDRIRVLRAEIDETIRESICCDVLKELMTRRGSTLSPDLQLAFQHRLQIIVRDLGMSQWHMHAIDDIACEIVRFALQSSGSSGGTDAELEDAASGMLHSQLKALGRARTAQDLDFVDTKDRKRIDEYGQDLFNQLFPRVFDCVEDFLSSSPYNIFLALVPPPAPPALSPTLPTMRPMERQQDLVRRIAHIVILHWRTWEHLVYNNEDLDRNTEGSNTEYSSRASTPGPEKPMKLQLTVQAVPEIPAPWAEVDKSGEGCATNKVPG